MYICRVAVSQVGLNGSERDFLVSLVYFTLVDIN